MDQTILQHLQQVDQLRRQREADAALNQRVLALKTYQQQRFANTYADLFQTPRYAATARFFLDELYGPKDYRARDAQFARVVPTLVRLFPAEVVATVRDLAELHALSEQLDVAMGEALPASAALTATRYRKAWQQVGQPEARQRQIALVMEIGAALERYTRKPLLRQALRLMRGPASAAGMGDLQHFLESGFDTFKAMKGADTFLQTVQQREQALAAALFAPMGKGSADGCPSGDDPLGQLP